VQDQISLTTRRAADIAGVERHVLLTSLQRHGHWRGVTPRRQLNGRLLWPTMAIYQALGRLPVTGLHSPAEKLRQHLCERAPHADPFHVQAACDALLAETAHGATAQERFASLRCDLADFEAHAQAVAVRVGAALNDENHATPADWRLFNAAAERIEQATSQVVAPLRWISGSAA
jgi:hypothetical protein